LRSIYKLKWSITTSCGESSDIVTIAFIQDGDGYGLPIKDKSGNEYKTVYIGNQLWMAENLKTTKDTKGKNISVISGKEWRKLKNNDFDKALSYYNNNSSKEAETYGALYTYAAAKVACPEGWHLPNDKEWKELKKYIASSGNYGRVGNALKSEKGWGTQKNPNENKYKFSALAGGLRASDSGKFTDLNEFGAWWVNTNKKGQKAYFYQIDSQNRMLSRYDMHKSRGASVRCIHD